jgi:hypothetical protein
MGRIKVAAPISRAQASISVRKPESGRYACSCVFGWELEMERR